MKKNKKIIFSLISTFLVLTVFFSSNILIAAKEKQYEIVNMAPRIDKLDAQVCHDDKWQNLFEQQQQDNSISSKNIDVQIATEQPTGSSLYNNTISKMFELKSNLYSNNVNLNFDSTRDIANQLIYPNLVIDVKVHMNDMPENQQIIYLCNDGYIYHSKVSEIDYQNNGYYGLRFLGLLRGKRDTSLSSVIQIAYYNNYLYALTNNGEVYKKHINGAFEKISVEAKIRRIVLRFDILTLISEQNDVYLEDVQKNDGIYYRVDLPFKVKDAEGQGFNARIITYDNKVYWINGVFYKNGSPELIKEMNLKGNKPVRFVENQDYSNNLSLILDDGSTAYFEYDELSKTENLVDGLDGAYRQGNNSILLNGDRYNFNERIVKLVTCLCGSVNTYKEYELVALAMGENNNIYALFRNENKDEDERETIVVNITRLNVKSIDEKYSTHSDYDNRSKLSVVTKEGIRYEYYTAKHYSQITDISQIPNYNITYNVNKTIPQGYDSYLTLLSNGQIDEFKELNNISNIVYYGDSCFRTSDYHAAMLSNNGELYVKEDRRRDNYYKKALLGKKIKKIGNFEAIPFNSNENVGYALSEQGELYYYASINNHSREFAYITNNIKEVFGIPNQQYAINYNNELIEINLSYYFSTSISSQVTNTNFPEKIVNGFYFNNCFAVIAQSGNVYFKGKNAYSFAGSGLGDSGEFVKANYTVPPNTTYLPIGNYLEGYKVIDNNLYDEYDRLVDVDFTTYFGTVFNILDTTNFKRFNTDKDNYFIFSGDASKLRKVSREYRQHLINTKTAFIAYIPSWQCNLDIGCGSVWELAAATGGTIFCSDLSSFDAVTNYIASRYVKEIQDTRKAGYLLVNEDKLRFTKNYNDLEKDTSAQNIPFRERWEFAHDKDFFEMGMGYFANSIPMSEYLRGKHNWTDFTSPKCEMIFDRVGKYTIGVQAEDNPAKDCWINGILPNEILFKDYRRISADNGNNRMTVYVARRPIADFNYIFVGSTVNCNSTSYDYDHISKPNKGIVQEQWKYKATDSNIWVNGRPPFDLQDGKTYDVSLIVKDEEGFLSLPCIKRIGIIGNKAPVAQFTLDRNIQDYNNPGVNLVHDFSRDPDGDPIVYHWWATYENGTVARDWGNVTPNLNDLINISKNNRQNNKFKIHLEVTDNPTGRAYWLTSLTSNIATQEVNIGTNNPPIADFEIEKTSMLQGEFNSITNKSYDPDYDEIAEQHWWVINNSTGNIVNGFNDISNKPELNKLNQGNYTILLKVKDSPKWGEAKESNTCERILTVVDAGEKLNVDADPTSVIWTNKDINVIIMATGGYKYKYTQYKWTRNTLIPFFDEFNKSIYKTIYTKIDAVKENEGIWYLHMKATDQLTSAYKMRYTYCLDVTPPEIDYSVKERTLNVTDELSGVKETYYKWSNNNEYDFIQLESVDGYTKWNGENVNKPIGYEWYLHVKSFDNAGNVSYRVFGPYNDPLNVTATLNPNPAKKGQKVTFNVSTVGYAKYLTIDFPIEINSLDSTGVLEYRDMIIKEEAKHNELVYYWLPVDTPLTLDNEGNRLREPYTFNITARKENGLQKQCEVQLDVKGSILEGIKTEIK